MWSGFRTIFQYIRLATPNRYKFYMFLDRITISEIFIKNSDFFLAEFSKIIYKIMFFGRPKTMIFHGHAFELAL